LRSYFLSKRVGVKSEKLLRILWEFTSSHREIIMAALIPGK